METVIISNGSKWAGEQPDSIDKLIEVLESEHVIEERFFKPFENGHGEDRTYHQFCPINKSEKGEGWMKFFGNFENLSHVFEIETNDPEVVENLTKAIKNNKGWKDYYHKNLRFNLMDLTERGKQAFYNTSFSPDKRGVQMCKDYTEALNDDLAEVPNSTQEQKVRYFEGFKKKFIAWLDAKSRCASSMITGPANFPVERNRKALDREHRVGGELEHYREKSIKAIKKAIERAKPQEQKDEEAYEAIAERIKSSAKTIMEIDNGVAPYSRPLFVSSITKAIETRAKNGEVDLVVKCLDLLTELNEKADKPIVTQKHGVWKAAETALKVSERKEEMENTEDKVVEYDGFKVIISYSDQRIRIAHDEKPEREVIDKIKKHGFRWSRYNTAWQRKLTNNAMYVTFKILLKDEKPVKSVQTA